MEELSRKEFQWVMGGILFVAALFGTGFAFCPAYSPTKAIVAVTLIFISVFLLVKANRGTRATPFLLYEATVNLSLSLFCLYLAVIDAKRLGLISEPTTTMGLVTLGGSLLLWWTGWKRTERNLNAIPLDGTSEKFDPNQATYSLFASGEAASPLRRKVEKLLWRFFPFLITIAVYSDFRLGKTNPHLNTWLNALGELALASFWIFLLGKICRQLVWLRRSERALGKTIRLGELLKVS